MAESEALTLTFRIILISLYSLFSIIRLNISRMTRKLQKNSEIKEKKFRLSFVQFFIITTVIIFFLYIFLPQWFDWSKLPNYPITLKWIGTGFGFFAIIFFIFVHIHLGKNFSYTLIIYEDHKLIKTGPYKLVRHPMYTAFLFLHSAVFLITGNWFIGLYWILGLIFVISLRIRHEEMMLVQEFGEEYISYQKETGALFPNIIKIIQKSKAKESEKQ